MNMHNPFERSFVKRECEFYNLQKYSKDGIKIEMHDQNLEIILLI